MAVILNKLVKADCLLGMWEITEDFYSLFNVLDLSEEEIETLNSFKSYSRKLEWLSVRVLLREMVGKEIRIYYNGNRKPFLTDISYNISISHSYKLTAILLSKKHRTGLDLEHITGKLVTSVAGKFLTGHEEAALDKKLRRYHLYLYWCAKEALYKICDKQNINFRDDIIIDPFNPAKQGTLKGSVRTAAIQESFELNYFKYYNYTVVWCCK